MSSTLIAWPDWSPEAWGALGTWIGSMATAAALVAAVLAWRGARDLYKIEVERDKESRNHERQSQASSIAGWVFPVIEGETLLPYSVVRNASALPVYSVEVEYWVSGTKLGPLKYATLPPGDDAKLLHEEMLIGEAEEPWLWSKWSPRELTAMRIALTFTDSATVRWYRDTDGVLSERAADRGAG